MVFDSVKTNFSTDKIDVLQAYAVMWLRLFDVAS